MDERLEVRDCLLKIKKQWYQEREIRKCSESSNLCEMKEKQLCSECERDSE